MIAHLRFVFQLGKKLGNEQAELVLNHANANSTYNRFYSRGTQNVDYVKVRLGEDFELTKNQKVCLVLITSVCDLTWDTPQDSLRFHDYTSTAVTVLVTRPLDTDPACQPAANRPRRRARTDQETAELEVSGRIFRCSCLT